MMVFLDNSSPAPLTKFGGDTMTRTMIVAVVKIQSRGDWSRKPSLTSRATIDLERLAAVWIASNEYIGPEVSGTNRTELRFHR